MKSSNKLPKKINQKRLVKMFKDIKRLKCDDNRFCFLIGAGASKSSGIPTGGELSKKWYNELKDDLDKNELKEWENKIGFNLDKIEEYYPYIYKKRFEISPQIGYDEFKKIMEPIESGLGYVILSQILAKEKHNFVITTNFDYLIEDAVRMYTSTKPFSAGHETLAEFISSQTERPTIIKVHRDLFLHPFNDEEKTKELKDEWKNALSPILKNFNLLVLGYGGNDGSLMDYLKDINSEDRKPIYWCVRGENILNDKINSLLTAKDYIVSIDGFDELMYSLHSALEYKIFDNFDDTENHEFVLAAKKRIANLDEKRKQLLKNLAVENKNILSDDTKNIFTGSSKYLLEAAAEENKRKREKIYKRGLKEYPDNHSIHGNLANLYLDLKEYNKAEDHYKKAIALDPKVSSNFGNYALLLSDIKNEYDKAEEYYKKAIKLNSENANCLNNYAVFLSDIRNTYDIAEIYFKKSIELEPNNSNYLGNYAHYLILYKQDFIKAEILINKAFEVEGNESDLLVELWFYRYAHFKNQQKQAELELEKLILQQAKSFGLNLHGHIAIAKKNKHPNIKRLQEFSDKISK